MTFLGKLADVEEETEQTGKPRNKKELLENSLPQIFGLNFIDRFNSKIR